MAEEKIKDLNAKLTKANKGKKSVEVALARAKRQAVDQCQQLRRTEDQLTIAKKQIEVLKKKLASFVLLFLCVLLLYLFFFYFL